MVYLTGLKEISVRRRLFSGWTVFFIVAFVIEMGVLILTQARGSYLAIGITGLVLMVLIPRWPRRWWAIGLIAAIGIGGVILIQQTGWGTIQSEVLRSTANRGVRIVAGFVEHEARNLVPCDLGNRRCTPDRIRDERFSQCSLYVISHFYCSSELYHGSCPQRALTSSA